ncbi:hypothetical protein J3R82DRAFT_3312, partial [Butyriboletus roseoflavus]
QTGLTDDIAHPAQKLNKLLKVLDTLKCSQKHRETSAICQSDICIWLPATDAYRSWKEGNDSFLSLLGKGDGFNPNGSVTDTNLTTAGAGKSVLACV